MNTGVQGEGPPPGAEGEEGVETLASGRPAVAAAPGKMLVLMMLAGVFLFIVVKSLFFGSSKHVVEAPKKDNKVAEAIAPSPKDLSPVPPLPTVPSLPTTPPAVLPPPPLPEVPPTPPKISTTSEPTNEQLNKRMKAPMIANSASAAIAAAASGEKDKKKNPPADPNMAFAQAMANSPAESVEATEVRNLDRTLIQGKLIQAVLETALNSELPGPVRAIVSHDTYSESGRNVLIPKGSRLIGTYNPLLRHGQNRVFIIWTRVVRPDGVDVMIDSPAIDALGRSGMTGDVDNKYFEAFATAIFTSSLDIGFAAAGEGLFGNQQQTTTAGAIPGTTTINSSPTATAMQTAIQNLGTVGQSLVGGITNLEPTINVDQGQLINVFVNKDVIFPSSTTNPSFIP